MREQKLTVKQTIAAAALGRGEKHAEAARLAGVHVTTVQRWLAQPDFRKEIAAELDRVLLDAGSMALRELVEELSDSNVWVRQNASRELYGRYLSAQAAAANTGTGIVVHFGGIEVGEAGGADTSAT